jgi:S1-C subfamily serine protease
LFGGSAGSFTHPQWNQPLLALGQGVSAENGALVFSLEGAFAGAVINRHGMRAIVPAEALLGAAERLIGRERGPVATVGVHLQPLNDSLRRATGASGGAIISFVDPAGPAAGVLAVGDVVIAVTGRPVQTAEQALLAIAQLAPKTPGAIQVLRERKSMSLDVTPAPLDLAGPAASQQQLGLKLRQAANGVHVEWVAGGSAAAAAGLRAGDVITWLAGDSHSGPGDVVAEWEQLTRGRSMMVAVDRSGSRIVLALSKP